MFNGSDIRTSEGFWVLEKLGQIRLSKHFFLRQFLYSEIAAHYAIPNFPSDPTMVVENGKRLCNEILEPIVSRWGPIVVRSGYRSPIVNALGATRGLKCASNSKNAAVHIWDEKDHEGNQGAAACVVVPSLIDDAKAADHWQVMARWLCSNVPFHKTTFFQRDFAFNIGWRTNPKAEIMSYLEPRGLFHV